MKKILFAESAIKLVLQELERKGYEYSHFEALNQSRYFVAYGIKGSVNVAVTFKKEWFLKFGDMFLSKSGIGDSVNVEDCKEFAKRNVKDLYVIHSSGSIYTIPFISFLAESHRWTNKEGKIVRSISIHKYDRYDPI